MIHARLKTAAFAVAAMSLLGTTSAVDGPRRLEFVDSLRLTVPAGSHSVRIWMPRLASDRFQTAELLHMDSPWPTRSTRDPEFGNRLIYLEAPVVTEGAVKVRARYRVSRREQAEPDRERGPVPAVFREPRGLVIVNEEVRRLATDATRDAVGPLAKARALYDCVLSRMDYDKSGEGWGRGDVAYACRAGKGNCTDFHSLFIALCLAADIPARFNMGYPLPSDPVGALTSYHCWAEFFVDGKGWIPVDISEAWKHPTRADYYFGRLDRDRVLVSTGREIHLVPSPAGPPLNYLLTPYVEVDGKPYDDFVLERGYKDLN